MSSSLETFKSAKEGTKMQCCTKVKWHLTPTIQHGFSSQNNLEKFYKRLETFSVSHQMWPLPFDAKVYEKNKIRYN